jgi:hypothetical protein
MLVSCHKRLLGLWPTPKLDFLFDVFNYMFIIFASALHISGLSPSIHNLRTFHAMVTIRVIVWL